MKAALYTGAAYIITVLLLIIPYLVINNYFACLAVTLTVPVTIMVFPQFRGHIVKGCWHGVPQTPPG